MGTDGTNEYQIKLLSLNIFSKANNCFLTGEKNKSQPLSKSSTLSLRASFISHDAVTQCSLSKPHLFVSFVIELSAREFSDCPEIYATELTFV